MAAKRGKSQAKRGSGMKTGLVLVVGLVIGLGLAAAYLMFGDRQKLDALLPQPDPQAQAPAPNREREPVAQEPEAQGDAPAGTPKPTYDFYTVLPEKEVELPGETAPAAASPAAAVAPANADPAAPAAPTAGAAPGGLQLQAGAFGNAGDAEALRAKLALLGQTARIETAQANGRTLHRVRLGPFANEAERAAVQAALADAGITAAPAR
jgi:cell division protein FtsN